MGISSISSIDLAEERSNICLEVTMLYKIAPEDREKYEEARKNKGSFQELADYVDEEGNALGSRPPVIELRHAMDVVVSNERISYVAEMSNDKQDWQWYVCLYAQYQATFQHCFEMHRFPFSRELLEVHFVCKQPVTQVMFVDYNDMVPLFKRPACDLGHVDLRTNICKSPYPVIRNWKVVNHFICF